jgi:hypothetical protein
MAAINERLKALGNLAMLCLLHLLGSGVAVLLSAGVIFLELWAYSAIIGETVETLLLGLLALFLILLVTGPIFAALSLVARVSRYGAPWKKLRNPLLVAAMISNSCLMLLPNALPIFLQAVLLILPSIMMTYVFATITGLRPEGAHHRDTLLTQQEKAT